MVTIVKAHQRTGERGSFMSLELLGEIEIIQSQSTGRFFATAKRCFITSTFSPEVAEGLVGSKLPGNIVRIKADPYEYTIPESGEKILLAHKYDYQPEESPSALLVRNTQTV